MAPPRANGSAGAGESESGKEGEKSEGGDGDEKMVDLDDL